MYTVYYNTGAGDQGFNTLDECFEKVNPTYTQRDIHILDSDNNVLYLAKWQGVEYDPEIEEDEPLADYGSFGYYSDWVAL